MVILTLFKIYLLSPVSDQCVEDQWGMEGRTFRRFGRRSRQSSLLPVGAAAPNHITANTVSCWYCDFKIRVFNEALFSFGRRHAAFLRVWFSIGIGFSLTLLLAVSCLLVWTLFPGKFSNNTAFFFLFGFSPSVSANCCF